MMRTVVIQLVIEIGSVTAASGSCPGSVLARISVVSSDMTRGVSCALPAVPTVVDMAGQSGVHISDDGPAIMWMRV